MYLLNVSESSDSDISNIKSSDSNNNDSAE